LSIEDRDLFKSWVNEINDKIKNLKAKFGNTDIIDLVDLRAIVWKYAIEYEKIGTKNFAKNWQKSKFYYEKSHACLLFISLFVDKSKYDNNKFEEMLQKVKNQINLILTKGS